MELVSSTVRSESFCWKTAVEDGLAVLESNWTVPGSVACKLMAVMSTSLGGLRYLVTLSASVTRASSVRRTRKPGGVTVISTVTVAM